MTAQRRWNGYGIACVVALAGLVAGGRALAQSSEGGAASPDATVVSAATSPIRVDGRLDDPAWRNAVDLGALTQREPTEGTLPSERTVVRLTFDADHLYIGVRCDDREPAGIVRTQMARDADLQNDDTIEIVLDTFLDHRNGYYFQVNALGAIADGVISNNAEPKKEWDGIWDARAAISDTGWSAEIAIPFKTLNFDPNGSSWGFNLQRAIRRKQETIRWRAARQNMRLAQLTEAGVITGLTNLKQGRGLDVRPYALGRLGHDASGAPLIGHGDVGLDVNKNVTPSLAGTLTVNTDFAETDVDARQVNLTRFTLFFPEKRTFFLQNAEIFQVTGQGQRGDQARGSDLLPFHSRRIGLTSEREPVPIIAGGKVIGRVGSWNVGVLDVQTNDFHRISSRNFFVARVARNLGRQSLIGGLVTSGDPEAADARPLAGLDARYARSNLFGNKNFVAEGSVFRTFLDRAPGTGGLWAGTLRIDYPNDPLGINISFKDIGANFTPGLGFVPRRGIRKGNYNIDYFQRPGKGGIRHQHWELLTETIHDSQGRLLNWRIFTAPVNIRTESGEHIEWNYVPQYEFLDAPFRIRPNLVVPAGGYTMNRYRAEFNSATKRRFIVDLTLQYGEFYDGTRVETGAGIRYRPNVHVTLQLQLSRNDVDLPQGAFKTQIWQARADVGFSPNLNLSNTLQYDTDSRIAGLNSRVRWTIDPGNDLFVVVNLGVKHELDRWENAYDRVTAKVQYTFRF
jgi:hypothetical protein